MDLQDRISVSPETRGGKPCIRGTRITVYDVLEYLTGGMTEDQLLADFPDLSREDIRACRAWWDQHKNDPEFALRTPP